MVLRRRLPDGRARRGDPGRDEGSAKARGRSPHSDHWGRTRWSPARQALAGQSRDRAAPGRVPGPGRTRDQRALGGPDPGRYLDHRAGGPRAPSRARDHRLLPLLARGRARVAAAPPGARGLGVDRAPAVRGAAGSALPSSGWGPCRWSASTPVSRAWQVAAKYGFDRAIAARGHPGSLALADPRRGGRAGVRRPAPALPPAQGGARSTRVRHAQVQDHAGQPDIRVPRGGWEAFAQGLAPGAWRAPIAAPASARSCAEPRSTSCRSSSTCCGARCRSWVPARSGPSTYERSRRGYAATTSATGSRPE